MTLGNRIQTLRKAAGLSQDALGEHLGVTRQAVSRWEVDAAVPEVDNLIAMGRLFGVTVDELLHGAPAPEEVSTAEAVPVETPDDQAPAPEHHSRWHVAADLAGCLIVAAAVIALCLLWGRVTALENQLADTQTQLAALQQQSAGLDPGAPLVANVELNRGWENSLPTIAFHLTAAQVNEDLKVTFLLSTWGGQPIEVEGKRAGAVFSGSYSYSKDYGCPDTITAVFDDGVRQYSRVLIRELAVSDGSARWVPAWMEQL